MDRLIEIELEALKRNYFTPEPLEDAYYFQSITFFVCNILTFGIYGVTEFLSKKRTLVKLEREKDEYDKQALRKLHQWSQLDQRLVEIRQQMDSHSLPDLSIRLTQLEEECRTITEETRVEIQAVKIQITFTMIFTQLLLTYATFGLYAVYQSKLMQQKIRHLRSSDTTPLTTLLDLYLKHDKAACFRREIALIEQAKRQMLETEEIRFTDVAAVPDQITRFLAQADQMNHERFPLRLAKAQKADEVRILTRNNLEAGELLEERQAHQLELQRRESREQEILERQIREVSTLQRRLTETQEKLSAAHVWSVQLEQLTQNYRIVDRKQELLISAHRMERELGPVASKYNKRVEDGEVPGADGVDAENDQRRGVVRQSLYSRLMNGKRSAEEIVEAGLFRVIRMFTKLSSEGSGLIFNGTSIHPTHPQYVANLRAVYRQVAFFLISGSRLHLHGCEYVLKLNSRGISIGSSKPVKVQSYFLNEQGERIPYSKIVLTHLDDFTPSTDQLPLGIDPVSIKWIYNRLTVRERVHLKILLSEEIFVPTSPQLLAAKEYMLRGDREKVQLMQTALELLSDMGLALQDKFDA